MSDCPTPDEKEKPMTNLTGRELADLHAALRADRASQVRGMAAPTERVEAAVEQIVTWRLAAAAEAVTGLLIGEDA